MIPIKNPLVSIVAICWNRKDVVRESLSQISELTYPNLEVILVDNCSTDGTVEMVKNSFPNVDVLCMDKNIGVSAYNFGFRKASGEYIIILDDDSYPEKGAIELMVEKFQGDALLGVVAFDVRDFKDYKDYNEAYTIKTTNQSQQLQNYLMSFHGAGAGVRQKILEKLGGYPDEFFLYFNETDLALRIWNEGYKIESFPDVIAFHKSSHVNRYSKRAPFYYTRNLFYIIWKHYPVDMMWIKTLQVLYYVFYHTLDQKTTVYIVALLDAIKNYMTIRKKRKPVKRHIAKKLRIHLESPFLMYR
ncbi:MAG: glycosyltransferase family 2 protein [Candidatus Magnetoovum sp. WYHC-5]|nr:glycosyltransferase family 2 protein [Candidatus Magnetoovum sp. WYHC-5]